MSFFIAEVSSNHYRDMERCYAFIDAAAEAHCQAVKFQLFKIDHLFAPDILKRSEAHRRRKGWELPVDFLPQLACRCVETKFSFRARHFILRQWVNLSLMSIFIRLHHMSYFGMTC